MGGDKIDGLVQDCSNSSAFEMEWLQSYTKPSRGSYLHSGISYSGKMTSLYWIWALDFQVFCSNLLT